jgi:hypothetical protein
VDANLDTSWCLCGLSKAGVTTVCWILGLELGLVSHETAKNGNKSERWVCPNGLVGNLGAKAEHPGVGGDGIACRVMALDN